MLNIKVYFFSLWCSVNLLSYSSIYVFQLLLCSDSLLNDIITGCLFVILFVRTFNPFSKGLLRNHYWMGGWFHALCPPLWHLDKSGWPSPSTPINLKYWIHKLFIYLYSKMENYTENWPILFFSFSYVMVSLNKLFVLQIVTFTSRTAVWQADPGFWPNLHP